MLVEQQNNRVHHEDKQQQSSAKSLQHVVTSQVEPEQPSSFSSPQACPDKVNKLVNFKFPKLHFGKMKLVSRSFQPQNKSGNGYTTRDLAFWHICSTAMRTG